MNVIRLLQSRLAEALQPLVADESQRATLAGMVRPTQDPQFGDFQANCAMPLGKTLGQNPRAIAETIIAGLQLDDLCEPPAIAGPGFINLRLKTDWIREQVLAAARDDRLGVTPVAGSRTIFLDYSSPNVAKPMHVGHLRSSVIGNSLDRLLRFLGHRVTSDNHVGDWGTQFGMILYGYKHFLDAAAYAQAPVAELSRLYRLVNQLSDGLAAQEKLPAAQLELQQRQQELATLEANPAAKTDKSLKPRLQKLRQQMAASQEELDGLRNKAAAMRDDPALAQLAQQHPHIARLAREETARLHAGDPVNLQLWQQFLPACLAAMQSIYDRLDIHFDLTLGESAYNPQLPGVVAALRERKLATTSAGAECVFLPNREAPFIIQKADGAYTYATTDLATIQFRVERGAEQIIYVVDTRQSEHFEMLFETARRWGYNTVDFRHVNFGTVMGPDKKPYKTRAGDAVGLESLLDEAVERARAIVDQNDDSKPTGPELDSETRQQVAEYVGIGGIKYADLLQNRESDYVFSWDKMLSLTGNTAAYAQYAVARTQGIFRRGQIDRMAVRAANLQMDDPFERALALQLLRLHDTLDDAARDLRPNLLCQYIFETAEAYSRFYVNCDVLKAQDEQTRMSRLLLCDLSARSIELVLNLLGIRAPERM